MKKFYRSEQGFDNCDDKDIVFHMCPRGEEGLVMLENMWYEYMYPESEYSDIVKCFKDALENEKKHMSLWIFLFKSVK